MQLIRGKNCDVCKDTPRCLQGSTSRFERGDAGANGGCIAAIQSDVFLFDTELFLCTASGDGGNIWLDLSYLYVDGASTISDGTSSGDGGNIAADGSVVAMHGEVFNGFAGNYGGGVAAGDPNGIESTISIFGDVYSNNASFGGGVYIEGIDSVLTVRGTITDNGAEAGGGILAELAAVARIEDDGLVSGNTADRGAGIRVMGPATVELAANAVIANNIAAKAGGGISAVNADIIADSGGAGNRILFEHNEALSEDNLSQGGGAMRLNNSSFTGTGVSLTDNGAASGHGGGILAISGSEVELTNSSVEYNTAGEGAGIYAKDSAITLLADTQLCDPHTLDLDRYCSQIFFNIAYETNGSNGRGGGISLLGTSTLDAEQTMIGYNLATVDGKQIAIDSAQAVATLRNAAVVTYPEYLAFGGGSAVDVLAGTLDLRSSTVAGHDVGLRFAAGSLGVMHRNIVADNNVGAVLNGNVTGNCNLSQDPTESPIGNNNEAGLPGFVPGARSTYEISISSTLAYDQCSAGPVVDIDGGSRPMGLWDRGMYEAR